MTTAHEHRVIGIATDGQLDIFHELAVERIRQDVKHGHGAGGPHRHLQDVHSDLRHHLANRDEKSVRKVVTDFYGTPSAALAQRFTEMEARTPEGASWAAISLEEFCEALEEAALGDTAALRKELIQLAAVCVAQIEDIDTRETAS